MWRNWNRTLLAGMSNGAATLENKMAVLPKVKHSVITTQQFHS